MPGPVKKLVVVAGDEGLILNTPTRSHRSLQIKYATLELSSLAYSESANSLSSAEVYGIVGCQLPMQVTESFTNPSTLVGLLNVAPVSYLITISQREQVALVRGYPIYVITDVALIPLLSQAEAQKAINQAKESLKKSGQHGVPSPDSDSSDDVEIDEAGQHVRDGKMLPGASDPSTKEDVSATRPPSSARGNSSVAEDVIEKKGQYGRFAERWFSKKGWTTEKRRAQGMSIEGVGKMVTSSGQAPGLTSPQLEPSLTTITLDGAKSFDGSPDVELRDQASESRTSDSSLPNVTNTLLPKLLRTTRMLLGSRSFFFSYELDITRRLGTNNEQGFLIPLHKYADPLVSIYPYVSVSISSDL